MARRSKPSTAFPESLKSLFYFNERWLPLERADLDRVPEPHRPPAACPTPLQMHFVDEGPIEHDEGEVVVCLHGNPTWSFYYRRLIAALRDDYRIVVPDHIGMGLSDKPRRYPYRLANHIGNLEALVNWLDLKNITLVVHDWGGAIGFGYAVKHPENVKRIVVLNTAAFRSSRIPWRIAACRWPLVGPLAVRGFNAFARAAITQATEFPEKLAGAVAEGLLWPYDSWAHRIGIQRFVEDIPMSPRHPSYGTLLEIETGLEKLENVPMLIGWGMKDWCFSPEPFLAEFERRFPSAEVHRYADAGHYVLEDAHDRLLPAIRQFLSRTAGQPAPAPATSESVE